MASHSSIYNWKRQENKPVFSSRGNVQEWVKQVQKACDDAAQDIFGDNAHEMLGRRDYYVDDDAILEGQDLIDSWIQKRDVDDLLAECEILDEVPTTSLAQYDKLSERFHYHRDSSTRLDSPSSYYEDDKVNVQKPVFDLDEDFDEECAVHEVVYNMLERDVVDLNSVNADEILFKSKTTKFKDPTPKMKLRHEQVKKRANQRKTAWEKANLKKMNERTVEEEARKQIQREEKRRLDNIKREEDEIRNEMVKIRRVMQEENAQRAILHSREAESDEKATKLAKKEVRKQQEENEQRLRQEYEAKATIKKKLLKQQEEEEMRKREDLKVLQSCFSSWYALVVNKQIKCGKARALLEWRRKLRIWNAWRTYVLRSRSDRETRALNEQMKERHRKEVLADRFYRQMLFHRCLTAWLSWVEKAKEEKILKEQHDKRAEKMAILLKAASSGQLCQETKIEDEECSRTERDSHAFDEEEISLKPFKLQDLPRTATQESRNCFVSKTRSKKENTTKQAWPHQRLKEMKNRKPAKKQNALLANIGSITTRTESSTTATQSNDNPRVEHSNIPEKEISQRAPSSNSKNVNLRSQSPRSNVVQNSASETLEQKVVDTDRNIGQAQKVVEFFRDNVNTRKHYVAVESSEPPQSARSTATTSTSKVTSRKPPTKPLHLAMEERAKARAERKSFLDSKKKVAEEEKLMKLKQEQEEKEKEIFAEKQAASQRKKEEMKLARQRELEKQQRLDEMRKMNKKADEHYHNTLLRDFGFLPWAKLIQTRDEMMNNAQVFYEKNLQSSCFREWLTYTRSECKRRNQLADNMYESLLLRFGWLSWRKYRNHLAEMDRIALEFSRRYVVKKYIKIWQDFVIEERLLGWDKENKADEHNDKRLLHKAMTYWKKYIPLLREEEKREKRRNNLRKHVTSLLPDFQNLHLNHSP